jgi:DNA-directed RNA polymerase III subunit RPC3
VELACDRIGETTSRVYAGVLQLIEDRIPRCQLDLKIDDVDDRPNGPSVSTIDLFAALGDTVNVAAGIGKSKRDTRAPRKEIPEKGRNVRLDSDGDDDDNASNNERKPEEGNNDMNGNGDVPEIGQNSDSDEDPVVEKAVVKGSKRPKVTFEEEPEYSREDRLVQLKKHLELLEADECRFLRRCGQNEWTVDFQDLVNHLKESEVNFILLENFGALGHRLIRMMRKYGKLDEKVLPQTALTTQKEIRTKLAEMQMAGIVEVQCIPRDAAHTVNRSIYLWFFDADRVTSMLLNNIYKTMTRCIQRLEIERRKASDILSLAVRSDVRENESEVLTAEQLNRLQNFRDKEEMLLGQAARLDGLVGIFRDY